MRVVYVCTDAGIPPFGRKGASVHVQAILDRLLAQGHEVHLVTPRPGPVPPHLAGLHVHPLPAPEGDDPRSREAAARATDRRVAVLLDRIRASRRVDMVYERYALWGRTAMAWARAHAIASVLEVNAPLPLEQARHRRLTDRAAADAVARSVTADAEVVVCVSAGVERWVHGLGGARGASVHVVPNGVDTHRFRATPPPARPVTGVHRGLRRHAQAVARGGDPGRGGRPADGPRPVPRRGSSSSGTVRSAAPSRTTDRPVGPWGRSRADRRGRDRRRGAAQAWRGWTSRSRLTAPTARSTSRRSRSTSTSQPGFRWSRAAWARSRTSSAADDEPIGALCRRRLPRDGAGGRRSRGLRHEPGRRGALGRTGSRRWSGAPRPGAHVRRGPGARGPRSWHVA